MADDYILTTRGRRIILAATFPRQDAPTGFYLVLCTPENVPTKATKILSELVEIDEGNGYTANGIFISADLVGWTDATEDDFNDRVDTVMQDVEWVAAGGTLPASGDGIQYAVLVREQDPFSDSDVIATWDLAGPIVKGDGESLVIAGLKIRLSGPCS